MTPVPEPVTPGPPHELARPVMLQGWHDLAALHWRYEPAEVQRLLPPGFTVDTFDGSAWVGLIPFHMRRIRLPGLPPFGPLSSFPETNIRTYIVDPTGRRGVWFMSLDITRALPTAVARIGYRLPYCWASMSITGDGPPEGPAARPGDGPGEGPAEQPGVGSTRRYRSQRRWPGPAAVGPEPGPVPSGRASSDVAIRVGPRIADGDLSDLDHFLSARWALGTTFGRRLMWARVSHPPWPLHAAELLHCEESLVAAAGLGPPRGEPTVRWSPGVEVRIGLPRPIRSRPITSAPPERS